MGYVTPWAATAGRQMYQLGTPYTTTRNNCPLQFRNDAQLCVLLD